MPVPPSGFDGLAPYYDSIMEFVNYDRWEAVCEALEIWLPEAPLHLDCACGTGVLVDKLRDAGWKTFGFDQSYGMVSVGHKSREDLPLFQADLRAVPVQGSMDIVTCLFDSINFLPTEEDVAQSIADMGRALKPSGILYFDVVTESMIVKHFAGPEWEEDNGHFKLRWKTDYDRGAKVANTRLRVNTGEAYDFSEHIYEQAFLERAIKDAGLIHLGTYDAEHWKPVGAYSTRIDFIATRPPAPELVRGYKDIEQRVRDWIAAMHSTQD